MEYNDLESVLTLGQREELESKGLWEDWLVKATGLLDAAKRGNRRGDEPFFQACLQRLYDGSLEHGLSWQHLDNLHESMEETLDGANYAVFEFLKRSQAGVLSLAQVQALTLAFDSMVDAWENLNEYKDMVHV